MERIFLESKFLLTAPLHSMPPTQGEPHKYYSTVRLCLVSGLWTKSKGQDNRMGKILEAFLTDQLRVDSGTERRTPEHQALCEKGGELQDQLAETHDFEGYSEWKLLNLKFTLILS